MSKQRNFPDAILKQHIAVLGKTGSGKTCTAKLIVEQVVAGDARVCVLDPLKSDWWGLISSASGKKSGLPFQILGGPHGHVPLHESAGKAVAEVVAAGALPLSIVDMADFKPGGQSQFFTDFAPVLLRRMKGVLYLVIEEAHEFAPKERSGISKRDENMAIHYAKQLATAGRSKGIRMIVATQRTQALHNAILGSCDTMIAHRLTAPADQKPVIDWLKANTPKEISDQVSSSLAGLKTGEGWLCSGEAQLFERRQFPMIKTYDNSKTPTGDDGEHRVKTAAVDADGLRKIIGKAVEEAEANDPKKLKATIASLEKQLASQKPVTDDKAVERAANRAAADRDRHWQAQVKKLNAAIGERDRRLRKVEASARQIADVAKLNGDDEIAVEQPPAVKTAANRPAAPAVATSSRALPVEVHGDLSKSKQKILDAIAWLNHAGIAEPERAHVAAIAEVSPKSSGYEKNVGQLKSSELLTYPQAGCLALTAAGAAIANQPEELGTIADLHAAWLNSPALNGPQQVILRVLIARYPESLTRDELAAECDVSPLSSGYEKNIGRLSGLDLVTYPQPGSVQAAELLFPR